MENKNIIIILVAVILVLACILGVMFLQPNAKQATKVKITSDKSQYEGGKLEIQLTDSNKTPISKEIVNVTVTNKKGKAVFDNVVKTNSKGKAKVDLHLKKGKYDVNVSYGGNENYTSNSTTQKLTIKEKVVETQPSYSRDTYVERTEGSLTYGYKDGRYGFWTPTGNFIEDKSRALSGQDPVEPFMEDGSFYDQI